MANQDQMDTTEPANSLESYTLEELSVINLPNHLALHPYEIQTEQGKEPYEQTIGNLIQLASDLNRQMTGEEYAFTGSMSMYALWYDLMERKPDVDIKRILNQRIKGGKNDFDIAVKEERKMVVMKDKLEFDDDAIAKQRGIIGNHMVDIQVRPAIKAFPYQEVSLDGQKALVQNPVEGIFERMSALAYPQIGNDGKENPKEIKWGVDIKLLKLYVKQSEHLTDDQLGERLESMWVKYQDGKKYQYAEYLASQVKGGLNPKELLLPSICELLNEDISIDELPQKIKTRFPNIPEEAIDNLLNTNDSDIFLVNIKQVIDAITPKAEDYEEMARKANDNYCALLEN